MKNVRLLLLSLGIILFLSYPASAQLTFDCDFNQDGVYESSWVAFPGQEVITDIYVSNVPEPGLFSFGFFLVYANDILDLDVSGISIDSDWYSGEISDSNGQATITGARCPVCGITGNNIRMVTVTFYATSVGASELWLLDRGDTIHDFVLTDGTVLDSDLGTGIAVGTVSVHRVGDFDGDGDVDGLDLSEFADQYANCTEFCLADINWNGEITTDDLALFGVAFGSAH
ncbi:MAG: hypothetical protein DRG59_12960 [Deltaproteobacteria bacterium]|nr:MAG: hypothetical protein DRG59_12960 [Deltaproteobacteria bacterium]